MELTGQSSILTIIFMIDTSGSMEGQNINAANNIVASILSELGRFEKQIEVRCAVITFNSIVQWYISPPCRCSQARQKWKKHQAQKQSESNFGRACKEVECKLHSNSDFFTENRPYIEPVIILFSDGEPTDEHWEEEFFKFKSNIHIKRGIQIAIASPQIEPEGKEFLKRFAEAGYFFNSNDFLKNNVLDTIMTIVRSSTLSGKKMNLRKKKS